MSTPTRSMDLSATIQSVSVWLHVMHVSQVGRFTFLGQTDFYMLDLGSSASMSTSNKSVWTICVFGVWLGRHYQHFIDSHWVNTAAASHAVNVAVLSIITIIAITSIFALNTCHNPFICAQCPVSTLNSFKNKTLTCSLNWRIHQSVYINLALLHQMVCSGSLISCATGVFAFAVILCTSISRLCTSVCMLDASAWLPQPFGPCEHCLAVSIALFVSVSMFGMPLCPFNTLWLLSPSVTSMLCFISNTQHAQGIHLSSQHICLALRPIHSVSNTIHVTCMPMHASKARVAATIIWLH
ncbi:hypothetical protein SCLCIDRAFT_27519 [Scleroderma citrinum Foug A]|uniref:Uncharacterized protein n=1 Tax=Scleroderma citrinum Foug A TaxID=1036808 RepID=A0A0C3DSC2_9AGAM|nr:hypothetical protein SCLCIDRAFT_27519 [Scleroderma citrinum Foug A]